MMSQPTQAGDEDKAFVFEGREQVAYAQCRANFGRGEGCTDLMHRLCSRIGYKNLECLRLQVEECHDKNWTEQTEAEEKCVKGQHVEPCYGIHKVCSGHEEAYCKRVNYSDRFCPYYRWIACRKEAGGSSNFVSKDCRLFHNKEMIKFHENKIEEALSWDARGENNAKYFLEAVKGQDLSAEMKKRKSEYEYIQNVCKALSPY